MFKSCFTAFHSISEHPAAEQAWICLNANDEIST